MAIDPDSTRTLDDLDSDEANERALSQLPMSPGGVYEVRREVARGGMGIILEAWDTRHGRAVAIKTLRHGSPSLVKRFLREVRLTSELQHPSIIPLYEAGRWPSGDPYYAMRLVEGQSLAKAAKLAATSRERLGAPPAPRRVVRGARLCA